jgi:hypothetical protein
MVAKVIVVVAGEEGKDETPPEFAQVSGNVVAQLSDAVSETSVGTWVIARQSEQAVSGNEGNALLSSAIKSGDHGNIAAANFDQSVFSDRDASLAGQSESENFSGCDIADI